MKCHPKTMKILSISSIILLAIFLTACGGGGGDGDTGGGDPYGDLEATIISPPENVTIEEGDSVTFRGSASGGTPSYEYYWNFDAGATDSTEQIPGDVIFNYEGEYDVSFTVTDTNGLTAVDHVSVEVTPSDSISTSPTATITGPSDGSIYTEGDSISFSGSGSDAEDGTLSASSLVWTSDIDGEIGTGTSFTRDDLSVGTHTITLTATDSDGATGSDSVGITVNPVGNTLPTATITSPSDGDTYTEGDSISFSGSGSDAEDGTLSASSLVWTSSIDGEIGTGTSFTKSDLSVGAHTITLTAIDSEGATGNDSVGIAVESAPTYPYTVVDTISVGSSPIGIAVTPDGSSAYVANRGDETVSVIQTSDNTVVDTISVGYDPSWGVAVTPNGDYVYVTNWEDGIVSVIQTSDNTVVDTISVGGPVGIAVTPNGDYVYVTNYGDDTVSMIQTSDNTVVNAISVGDEPWHVAVTPNGDYVYVTNWKDNTVSVIQTSDNTVIDTTYVGLSPVGIAVTPNGDYVYVANESSDTVSVIQTSDNTVVKAIYLGKYYFPYGVAVTPNGDYVYVTNHGLGDSVSVIQTSDNTVLDTIPVGDGPYGIAVTPNGNYVYVANSGDDTVSVIGF